MIGERHIARSVKNAYCAICGHVGTADPMPYPKIGVVSVLRLSQQALELASAVLEKHGEEDARGLIRSAIIEIRTYLDKPFEL